MSFVSLSESYTEEELSISVLRGGYLTKLIVGYLGRIL